MYGFDGFGVGYVVCRYVVFVLCRCRMKLDVKDWNKVIGVYVRRREYYIQRGQLRIWSIMFKVGWLGRKGKLKFENEIFLIYKVRKFMMNKICFFCLFVKMRKLKKKMLILFFKFIDLIQLLFEKFEKEKEVSDIKEYIVDIEKV